MGLDDEYPDDGIEPGDTWDPPGDGTTGHYTSHGMPIEGSHLGYGGSVKVYESLPSASAASWPAVYARPADFTRPPLPRRVRAWRAVSGWWKHHVAWRFERSGTHWDSMGY